MTIIFLGLVLAYNPVYLYYLMSHGALGGMSIRATVGGVFLLFAVMYIVFRFPAKRLFVVKTSPIFSLITIFLGFYLIGVLTGFIRVNFSIFFALDAYPLFEMFCIYYIIRLSPGTKVNPYTIVKWVSGYILIMCLSDLAAYSYLSFVKKIGFGALRANINGIIMNRLMDFMVPILGPGLIALSRYITNRFVRWLLPVCVLVTVALTFYRTVYVAFFVGVLFLIFLKKKNIIPLVKAVTFMLVIGFLAVTIVQQGRGGKESIGILSLVNQRIRSTFDSRKKDYAINSRFEQTARSLQELPNVSIIGYGMGGYIDDHVIQVMSNYFLQLFLLLGIPAGILFLWLYTKVMMVLLRLARMSSDRKISLFYLATASVLAGLAVVFCFFPYTVYFPLLYLFGAIAAIADVGDLALKSQLAIKIEGAQ